MDYGVFVNENFCGRAIIGKFSLGLEFGGEIENWLVLGGMRELLGNRWFLIYN
jgi:hypothetical protein